MQLSDLFNQTNSAFRGSDDNAPTAGTDDYTNWLFSTNRKISEWSRDTKNTWESLFSYEKPIELGTVSTAGTITLTGTNTYFTDYQVGDTLLVSGETVRTIATIISDTSLTVTVAFSTSASSLTFYHASIIATTVQSYNLHRRFLVPSDEVFAITTDQVICYNVGKPQERARYYNEVYIAGLNPKTLTFYGTQQPITQVIGGTLKVPGYYQPIELSAADDIVPVDDPMWLVYSLAAELAGNDLTYEDKADSLNTQANNLYAQMSQANRRGTNNNPRVLRTNVQSIRGTDDNWRTDAISIES